MMINLLISCNYNRETNEPDLFHSDGSPNDLDNLLATGKINVFVFMSPECPVCISAVDELKRVNDFIVNTDINFYLVYPGTYYDIDAIKNFHHFYQLEIPFAWDKRNSFVKRFKAKVTPEVFLLSSSGDVVYSGAINDKVEYLGAKKQIASKNYLMNALMVTLNGGIPDPARTLPVGCYIE
jgi:thiol-disulfide isomerase/thioredoxin